MLRRALRAPRVPPGRAAMPSAKHHDPLHLYRQKEWLGHPLRVHRTAAYTEGEEYLANAGPDGPGTAYPSTVFLAGF